MNTDRELLEKAAKAAGYPVPKPKGAYPWQGFEKDGTFYWLSGPDGSVKKTWNPLTNDTDAFRLMCDLHLEVAVHETYSGVINGNLIGGHVKHGDDIYAATRRAITTAAAELWRMRRDQA